MCTLYLVAVSGGYSSLWCVADWYRAVVTREPGEVGKVRPAERAQEERELEDLSRLGAGQGGWVSGSLTA